jgi:hypothetical protein
MSAIEGQQFTQDFVALSTMLCQDAAVFYEGFDLRTLFSIFTTDPWFSSVEPGTQRWVTFDTRSGEGNSFQIDIKKGKGDQHLTLDLTVPELSKWMILTWKQVIVDPNLLHCMLFSIASNIGPMQIIQQNWSQIHEYIMRQAAGDNYSMIWDAIAHFAYIFDNWQGGSEDKVFQHVVMFMTKNVRVHPLLIVDKDKKFSLKKDINFIDILNDDNAVASYICAQRLFQSKFEHEFKMDRIKGNSYYELVFAMHAKAVEKQN